MTAPSISMDALLSATYQSTVKKWVFIEGAAIFPRPTLTATQFSSECRN